VRTRINLDADPASVGRARLFCATTLEGWGADTELVATCSLLVSELASNAVLHARTPFTVALEHRERLRVEVLDGDPRPPHPCDYRVDALSGRGLHLVEALARASGTTTSAGGKSVWFELDWHAQMVP